MKNMFKSLICSVVLGAISLPALATEIAPHALFGRWQCMDETSQTRLTTTKQYAFNGRSSIGFALQSLDGGTDAMEVSGSGLWRLTGDTLVEQPLNYTFTVLNVAGADMLGSPMETAMTTEMLRAPSKVQILKISQTSMVISPFNTSQEMTCMRM